MPSSQENRTIRNSLERTRTFRKKEEEEEEEEEARKKKNKEEEESSSRKQRPKRAMVRRERVHGSCGAEEDENTNAVITLKGEIQGKNVTITLDTSKQSNNMEAELDVREDSCFTNDAWMNQLGEKFRVELKVEQVKEQKF